MAAHDLPTKPGSDHSVISLATPCYGGLVHQAYMMRRAEEEGFHLDLALLGNDPLITRSRSIIVAKFLDTPQATHLLFVDADIAFEPEQLLRMLRFDKDFVAGLYPLKTINWEAVPHSVVGGEGLGTAGLSYVGTLLDRNERHVKDGFATAKYAGSGFQLIKRGVFERLAARAALQSDPRARPRSPAQQQSLCTVRLRDRRRDRPISQRGLCLLPALAGARRRDLARSAQQAHPYRPGSFPRRCGEALPRGDRARLRLRLMYGLTLAARRACSPTRNRATILAAFFDHSDQISRHRRSRQMQRHARCRHMAVIQTQS